MALWANVLLGVGGDITFADNASVPSFPATITQRRPALTVDLEPYSQDLVERVFMPIEAPGPIDAPTEPDVWESQGQFYGAIWEAIERLDAGGELFNNPQRERQIDDPHGYMVPKFDVGSSGGLLVIDSLASAGAALSTIVHQGEGVGDERYADPDHAELTHYAKFLLLDHDEAMIAGVAPAVHNPTVANLPSDVAPVAALSDALTTYLYLVMDRLLSPVSDEHHHQVGLLYGSMVALQAPVARYLMTLPISSGEVAGPPFGFFEFDQPSQPEAQLRGMAHDVVRSHPDLQVVVDLLHRLPQS